MQLTKLDKYNAITTFTNELNNGTNPNNSEILKSVFFGSGLETPTSGISKSIKKLRENRHDLWQQPVTRSATYAAVVYYLNDVVCRSDRLDSAFESKNSELVLNKDKFIKFIEGIESDDGETAESKLTMRYLDGIKFSSTLGIIVFNADYAIEAKCLRRLENDDRNGLLNRMTRLDINGIKNKKFRKIYTETETKHAKRFAESYFKLVIDKIKDNQLLVGQFIYLNRLMNIAARNLSNYTIDYNKLKTLLKDIFRELRINLLPKKNEFINNLFIVNYHRNCGMTVKGILKIALNVIWHILPIIIGVGVVMLNIASLNVFAIAGAVVGMAGTFVTNPFLYNINCGDKLTFRTNTYKQIEKQISGGLQAIMDQLPTDEEVLEGIINGNYNPDSQMDNIKRRFDALVRINIEMENL